MIGNLWRTGWLPPGRSFRCGAADRAWGRRVAQPSLGQTHRGDIRRILRAQQAAEFIAAAWMWFQLKRDGNRARSAPWSVLSSHAFLHHLVPVVI